jgi:hypothetical protein
MTEETTDWQRYGTVSRRWLMMSVDNPLDTEVKEKVEDLLGGLLEEGQQREELPEVAATLERLLSSGLREDYARYLLLYVLAAEILQAAESGPTDDWDRLRTRLSLLPKTPWIVADLDKPEEEEQRTGQLSNLMAGRSIEENVESCLISCQHVHELGWSEDSTTTLAGS